MLSTAFTVWATLVHDMGLKSAQNHSLGSQKPAYIYTLGHVLTTIDGRFPSAVVDFICAARNSELHAAMPIVQAVNNVFLLTAI